MQQLSKYESVVVAYRSRLLWRTDNEYREALGATFETVVNNRNSAHDTSIYYSILNSECEWQIGRPLDEVIGDYIEASEFYRTVDWGDRSQMASRKRLCRMLFRLYATAGMELSVDEILKFKVKDDDKRLTAAFFPGGSAEEPAVELAFIMLFAFGVMKPWSGGGNSRSHDIRDKETIEALGRLRSLIEVLRDDTPRLGSTEKPMVFHEWLEIIDSYLSNSEPLSEVAPLMFLSAIMDIARACRSLAITEQRRMTTEQLQGYDMPGIWIDDADRGENRFWIFPDNMLYAFCYFRDGNDWTLAPYELRIRFGADDSSTDSFIIVTPEGNLRYSLSPERAIDNEQLGSGGCDCRFDETSGEMCLVELYEEPGRLPAWLNWRRWERLDARDERYPAFRDVLRAVYNPDCPDSLFLRNIAPELTDLIDNLAGRDRKYLYVYDARPQRFAIREIGRDRFIYESATAAEQVDKALFELNISEDHPLYALTRSRKKERYGNRDAAVLADILDDADNIGQIYIMHSTRAAHPRLIFPNHGLIVKLDMETLEEAGVVKYTEKPF